ncbi:MAG TPA: HEAT repeat domain-containing protein [Bryobacteraceae bacterium]|nr:HEAT repeat domain-containing protein [Bryobacteraceae bacterium]
MRQKVLKHIGLGVFLGLLAYGQAPRTGDIEFYGLHKVSAERLLKVLKLKKGDPIPPSKGDLEDRLERVSGIVQARVEAVCCEGDFASLFIGVEERGTPHFALRSPPEGDAHLPPGIVDTYRRFLAAAETAARRGSTAEDLTQGHSLMADPDSRDLQEQFASYARDHLALLRQVLRTSADDEQRAMAATIIGYAPDKKAVVNDLEYAIQDPDEAVRSNAARALGAIAVLARLDPGRAIRISPTWFVEMLNSIVLSDRLRAAGILAGLTEQDGAETLTQIRDRALSSVVEMARWKNLRYALPAFLLAGRMAGLPEPEIQDAWSRSDRERVLAKLLAKQPKDK